MVDPINGSDEINLHDPSLLPTIQCTFSLWDMHKSATQVPRPLPLHHICLPTQKTGRLDEPIPGAQTPYGFDNAAFMKSVGS